MDNYQAVYDAVRSKFSGVDVGDAIRSAIENASLYHHAGMASLGVQTAAADVANAMMQPSVLFRPKVYMDGNQWCALYGEDLMVGVAGFGDSPAEAMADFDKNWNPARKGKEQEHE